MPDQTPAERLRCFIAVEQAEGATADTPVIDGVYTLTFGDLEAVLTERDQFAAAIERTTAQMREYVEHGCATVNVRQVISLLSPTWPDGNYASMPPRDAHSHQDASAAPSATDEPGEHPFELRWPVRDVQPPAPHRVTARTVRVLGPERGSEWHDEVTYDVDHTPQCDALPYGQNCWIDEWQTATGTDDWPTEPGQYDATLETWTSYEGEHDARIDFEPAPTAPPEQPR